MLLYFRVMLEGVFLWLGGVGVWYLTVLFFYDSIEQQFGIRGGDIFYALLTVTIAIFAIWILIARCKEMADRISKAAYFILTFLPLPLIGALILMYLSSFD